MPGRDLARGSLPPPQLSSVITSMIWNPRRHAVLPPAHGPPPPRPSRSSSP
jgi:hypothetical protein